MKKLVFFLFTLLLFSESQSQSQSTAHRYCSSSELKGTNWNYSRTNHGYIKFGPTNPTFAHIYTDRPRFIFNRDVYSYYGGFSAYNRYNLSLKTNGITRMLIKRTNGYVGIGTTNPRAKLDVRGNAKISANLDVQGSSTVHNKLNVNQGLEVQGDLILHGLDTNATPNISQFLSVSPSGHVSSISAADIQQIMYAPSHQLQMFNTSHSVRLSPTWEHRAGHNPSIYTGVGRHANVGIGTDDPSAKLDVRGNAKISANLDVQGSSTVHNKLNVNQGLEVQGDLILKGLDTNATPKSSKILSVSPNGSVSSIAIADIKIQLYDSPCIQMAPTIFTYMSDESMISDGPMMSSGSSSFSYPAPAWSSDSGSNPTLYTGVGCPANVGIGTSNPQADLHVEGDAIIRTGLEITSPSSKLEVRGNAIFDKSIAVGTEIQSGYDLAVCGNIRAADIKVNAISEWCDYVFEDDYDLKSLQEVEAFIQQNKHLPEVPSALEVETEGIAVSEMLQLMMKKIEELTLYTIEQDKRIQELENTK